MSGLTLPHVPMDFNLSVSAPDHIISNKQINLIQNCKINANRDYLSDIIIMGSKVNKSYQEGNVIFENSNVTMKASDVYMGGETIISKGCEFIIKTR